jgi:phosphoadenosine phosphosulfate reductase
MKTASAQHNGMGLHPEAPGAAGVAVLDGRPQTAIGSSSPATERPQRRSLPVRSLVQSARVDLEDATAEQIVAWAAQTFGDRLAVASSMADAVVVDLVSRIAAGVDVLFLDTGYHFPETIGIRDAVEATYPVRVVTIEPTLTVREQDAGYGADLFARDPDRCCAMRKVEPLRRALTGYDAWITGLRRADSPARARTGVVEYDAQFGKVKINPIARWSDADVEAYIAERGIVVNPLLLDGYASIGCAPCTRRVASSTDPRAGRWAGFVKTECGIHDTGGHQ